MEKENKDLFKDKRWNEYQPVNVLKTKVKRTKEDEKNTEEFVEFIDKKIKKEEDTKNK